MEVEIVSDAALKLQYCKLTDPRTDVNDVILLLLQAAGRYSFPMLINDCQHTNLLPPYSLCSQGDNMHDVLK